MADSCHLDFLKKDQLFSLAILAYHITSLPKAIYEKKSNVIFRRLKSRWAGSKQDHEREQSHLKAGRIKSDSGIFLK